MVLDRRTVITINNNDVTAQISSGTIRLTEMLVDGEFQFGQLCTDMFECQIYGYDDNAVDLPIFVNVLEDASTDYLKVNDRYLVDHDRNKYVVSDTPSQRLFTGKIDSCKKDYTNTYRDIIAYSFNRQEEDVTSWWNTFWTPSGTTPVTATVKTVRQSLMLHMGITEIDKTLPNENLQITAEPLDNTTVTFQYVIRCLCEIQQCFPHINRDGVMEYVTLGTTAKNLNNLYEQSNSEWEDNPVNKITGVAVYSTSDTFIQGTGTYDNAYLISGNIFLLNMSATALNNFLVAYFDAIKNIAFTPCKLSLIVSDLSYRLGDKISYNGNTAYIFENELSGVQYVDERITCGGNANRSQVVSTINNAMMESNKFSKVEQTIDEFRVEVGATYTTKSEFNTTVAELQDQIDGTVSTWSGYDVPTLNNEPAVNWTTTDEKDRHIGDVYYVSSDNPDYGGYAYRFEKSNNVYQWGLIQDSQVTKALEDAAQALQEIGALDTELHADYSTTTQMNSAISSSATNVLSTVSSTYETITNVTAKIATADTNAQGYASTAQANAETYADGKASTAQSNAESYADGKASTAESNAKGYTDTQLASYSTTTQMESAINQSAQSIEQTVSATYTTKTEFNGLVIGGGNLIKQSNTYDYPDYDFYS